MDPENDQADEPVTGDADQGEKPDTPEPETGEQDRDDEGAKRRLLADLAKERRERKKAAETIERLRSALDGEKESQAQTVASVQAERDAARADALRYRVALEEGLPSDLAKRLVGEDEDALRADAKSLLALVRKPKTDARNGASDDDKRTADPNALLRQMIGGR